jgi:signal transduction histidine kinase
LEDSLVAFDATSGPRAQELFEIAPLLEREAEDRRRGGASVALAMSPAAAAAQILGDPLAVRRLVANLTDNAVAYGREAAIAAEVAGGELVLTIDDKGPGISPAERERVLEPFVRLEASRNRNTGGAGLGLAIAAKAAESHGGSLVLGDAPGGGTRASVRLPVFRARTTN